MRLIACVLMSLMLALAAGCVSSGGKRADNERPDWVDGSSKDWPRSAWLTGVGVADDPATARDRARAELAKVFRVAVNETTTDVSSYSASDDGMGTTSTFVSDVQRDLSTRTDQVLEGVTLPETWTDPTGRVYALAALNRAQAAMRLRQEISSLDAAAESMLQAARNSDDAFAKAKLAIGVVGNQRQRATAQSMLQAVDATGRGVPPRWPLGQLEADLETALSRITLRASGEGEWQPILAGKLAGAGFSVADDGPYAARLTVDVVEMPQQRGWHWRRAVAVLDISGPQGRSLGQHRWEFKESATDPGTAEFRLREAVGKKLDQESRSAILGIISR